jgi:hypothetical protein
LLVSLWFVSRFFNVCGLVLCLRLINSLRNGLVYGLVLGFGDVLRLILSHVLSGIFGFGDVVWLVLRLCHVLGLVLGLVFGSVFSSGDVVRDVFGFGVIMGNVFRDDLGFVGGPILGLVESGWDVLRFEDCGVHGNL